MLNFRRKISEVKIVPTKNLPIEKWGGVEDANKVYTEMFKNASDNGKPYIVYSAGIGTCIDFELDLLNKFKDWGIDVELFAIDPTPKSLDFLSKQELPGNFHVLPYALSNKDEKLFFALPLSEGWVSGSAADVRQDERNFDFHNRIEVQGRTIESIMHECGHSRIDLLKMDIEGSEFDVLEEALCKELNIVQMCVDHHEYMIKNGRKRIIRLLNLINKKYDIFCTEDSGNKNFSCILKSAI